MPQPNNHVDLIIVVSGRPEPVRVNPKQKITQLVREALNQTGNHGQPPESWELRTEDGTVLDQDQTVEHAGLQDGMTLFLSPQAGAGGTH